MATDPLVRPVSSAYRRLWLPLAKGVGGVLLFFLGPVRTKGQERVPKEGGVLILANHIADMDPVVLQYACPRPIHFMAKSEIFEIPVIGWLIRRFHAFAVKRGEPDRQALKYAASLLHAGEAVGIFPEGQLSEDGQLQPLKAGIALIIRMAGTPVICCGIAGTHRIIPYGKVIPRPAFRSVHVQWGEARRFTKEDRPEDILAWVSDQLRSLTGKPIDK